MPNYAVVVVRVAKYPLQLEPIFVISTVFADCNKSSILIFIYSQI